MRRSLLPLAAVVVLLGGAAPAARAEATWRLEQPAPPAGSPYKVPLGRPGDLSCWSATRCLLAVEGNAIAPRGLYSYDGAGWHSLSSVCGGPADTTRIAWAGPDEFWTVTEPSLPRLGGGLGLCRFRGGQVIGSYSTAPESPDPFRVMTAAACNGPNDCWFAGVGSQDPGGQRVGAYHLHWDGSALTSSYAPQGRGVSDVIAADGRFLEATLAGVQREDRDSPLSLATPEPVAQTIHSIAGGRFRNEPFTALPRAGVGPAGTELLAADVAAGTEPWFVGGGAASGPGAPAGGSVPRPPIAVRLAGGIYRELPLDETPFGATDRFTDVAAVPGEDGAWTTVQAYAERGSTTARARVAHLRPDGTATVVRLPAGGAGRGAAARVEFTGPGEGWMVTNAGWVFHFTDGTPRAAESDPAFARAIAYRPNEAVAQAIPDLPPVDDSLLFAPPEVAPEPEPEPPVTRTVHRKALMYGMSKPAVDRRLRLRISFRLRRPARVQLLAKRRRAVVARTSLRPLKPGRHTLTLQLARTRWPDELRFVTKETKR